MNTKLIITAAILMGGFVSCGDARDRSNMDTTTDSLNTMTTYPSETPGTYGTPADSANYNNRNDSSDDSAGMRKPGSQVKDSGTRE